MIGNDVVDITQSRKESNWQRIGFITKIFTADEQLLIENAVNPEIMVWLLWSMKEAAYKIYNRQTKIRAFIPKKLECSILWQNSNESMGQVSCFGTFYQTKTSLFQDFIHTIAVSSLHDLNHIIEIENKNITKDRHGIPHLFIGVIYQDVSVSHHGRFEEVVTLNHNNFPKTTNTKPISL